MRNDRIDALKGLAILSVVVAHSVLITYGTKEIPILGYADAYMIPLFVFLSGWVLYYGKSCMDTRWIADKAVRLLVPFLCWMPITYVVGTMEHFSPQRVFFDHSEGLVGYVLRSILYPGNGLWFLWALFMLYVIVVLMQPLKRKIGDAAYLVTWGLLNTLPSTELFCLGNLKTLFMFFTLGYLVNKHQERLQCFALPFQVATVPLFLMLGWYWNSGNVLGFSLSANALLLEGYRYTTSLFGIGAAFLLARLVRSMSQLNSALIGIGSVSLEIYCIHVSLISNGLGDGLLRVGSILAISFVTVFTFLYIVGWLPLLNLLLFGINRAKPRISLLSRLSGERGLIRQ